MNPPETIHREPSNRVHAFLIQAGVLLHRYGTPSHRLERVLCQLSQTLGVEGTYLYTPTALISSIADEEGELTYVRRVDSGPVDVDKLIRFDETLERLEAQEISLSQASQEMHEIAESTPPFPAYVTAVACALSCAAVAVFFRGDGFEVLASALVGLLIAVVEWGAAKLPWDRGFLEPIAGFLAALASLGLCRLGMPIDDRLVTLAGLIVLVPGLSMTVGLTELAVGHLSAGVARIAGASVTLLTMSIGVALGWRVAGDWRAIPQASTWELASEWQWLAIVIAPICFAIVFRARWRQWFVIVLVTVCGFVSSLAMNAQFGIESGAFMGALVVGVGSNLYARLRDRPALVPLTPGILVLVPGSLGYRSLTAFINHETLAGVDAASSMLIIASALVGGILAANVFLPPKRIL